MLNIYLAGVLISLVYCVIRDGYLIDSGEESYIQIPYKTRVSYALVICTLWPVVLVGVIMLGVIVLLFRKKDES